MNALKKVQRLDEAILEEKRGVRLLKLGFDAEINAQNGKIQELSDGIRQMTSNQI